MRLTTPRNDTRTTRAYGATPNLVSVTSDARRIRCCRHRALLGGSHEDAVETAGIVPNARHQKAVTMPGNSRYSFLPHLSTAEGKSDLGSLADTLKYQKTLLAIIFRARRARNKLINTIPIRIGDEAYR